MHFLYFVATPKKYVADNNITDSLNISKRVSSILGRENFANSDGGFFSNSKADWFVVGGRWSGLLSELFVDDFSDKACALIKDKTGREYISQEDTKTYGQDVQNLWESMGGIGLNTITRSSYVSYEDDTKELSQELVDAFKNNISKGNHSEVDIAIVDEYGSVEDEMKLQEFFDIYSDTLTDYYITVIDYHN